MSLASLRRVLGSRIALGGALLACACQHDSNAAFDDTNLPPTEPGSSGSAGTAQGGSGATAGESSGGRAAGGGKATAGSSAGGKASSGGAGGKGGGMAGKAGADMGGSAGEPQMGGSAGNPGMGGAGMAGMAGSGGKPADPEPITFETTDIDDTMVEACMPGQNFGEREFITVDGNHDCRTQALISVPLASVPDGAVVSDASLSLTCIEFGPPIDVSYADGQWSELQVRWNNAPGAGTIIGQVTCEQAGQVVTLDLTKAVTAWLAGDRKNFGIYLATESSSGTSFSSSEAPNDAKRPKLSVTYTLPVK